MWQIIYSLKIGPLIPLITELEFSVFHLGMPLWCQDRHFNNTHSLSSIWFNDARTHVEHSWNSKIPTVTTFIFIRDSVLFSTLTITFDILDVIFVFRRCLKSCQYTFNKEGNGTVCTMCYPNSYPTVLQDHNQKIAQ